MQTPVSIIIPAFNQLDYCRQCIESLRANTDYPYRLILVDNGSTDGVSEYFDSVPGAVVVHNPTNVGFPAGVNRGLAHAEGHVLLLNSDTVLPAQWLSRLVASLDSHPRIGVIGPMSNCVSGPQHIPDLALSTMDDIDAVANRLHAQTNSLLLDVDRVVGFCMLIRDSAFQSIGTLDESFGMGNFEDDDYCLRARKAGFRVCIATNCFVFHFGSRTFQALGFTNESYSSLINQNETRFNEKWGTRSDRPRSEQLAEDLLVQAQKCLELADARAALALLRDATALNPRNADVHNAVGLACCSLGNLDHACRAFERALQLNPSHDAARNNLADACRARENNR